MKILALLLCTSLSATPIWKDEPHFIQYKSMMIAGAASNILEAVKNCDENVKIAVALQVSVILYNTYGLIVEVNDLLDTSN